MSEEIKPSAEEAVAQQGDGDWPKPGDEGYVHPDGTPQAAQQLADNKRAAADRAAAGSVVHGAPLATPGPQAGAETQRVQERAAEYSGPTAEDAEKGLTKFIEDGIEQRAQETAEDAPADDQAKPAAKADQETTVDKTPRTRRA